jgi:tRNA threonylcarbamoyladenosine biosynthesis protein TsaE
MTKKILVDLVLSEDQLPQEIHKFTQHLQKPFVMNLVAAMGSGKSTFVRALLYHLGLNPKIPVTSPTFTLMNDYDVGDKCYAHLDLYRLSGQPDMEEWGLLDTRSFHGVFIEWPEIVSQSGYGKIKPTHELRIETFEDVTRRRYVLFGL